MRISATQLRILLLTTNLLLALGVPSYALYAFYTGGSHPEPVEIISVDRLEPGKEVGRPVVTGEQRIQIVGQILNQTKATPVEQNEVKPPETPTAAKGTGSSGILEPGPLGDSWDYAFYIIREDPLDNLVTLKKKDAGASGPTPTGPGSTRSRVRPITPPMRNPRPGAQRKIGPQQPSDRITFLVSDRQYINEELGLNFYIHSADEDQFVYWMQDTGPKKMFALKYVKESFYLTEPKEGLRPPPQEKPEDGTMALPPEEKVKKHFVLVPEDFESQIESEYAELLNGAKPGPAFNLLPSSGGSAAEGAQGKGPVGAAAGAGVRKPPTEAEKREAAKAIKEVMGSPKMTAKDREELGKALKGVK